MIANNDGWPALVRLSRGYTMIHMTPANRVAALHAAYWVTGSACEHTWTEEQQELMARYVLWASQRIEAIEQLASGKPLMHEPDAMLVTKQSKKAGGGWDIQEVLP